jgi:cytochrome c-type biogenesis protein
MQDMFTQLSHALEGAPAIALLAAAMWGVLSIVLSPCHLASIPLVVAFVSGQERRTTSRALVVSTLFATGILLTIIIVGGLTALAGRMLGDTGGWTNYLVALVFILVGLYLLDVIPINWNSASSRFIGTGLWAAMVAGLVFGLAVGPCTFAYMAPMLSVTFKLASSQLVFALSLLLAFAIGHCLVIVIAGACANVVQKYLMWTDLNGTIARRSMGAMILIAGLIILWAA